MKGIFQNLDGFLLVVLAAHKLAEPEHVIQVSWGNLQAGAGGIEGLIIQTCIQVSIG